MKYIETFREGERISEIFLCKHKQSAVTKNGKPYETVIFRIKQERWMLRSGNRILQESKILMH